MFNARQWMMLVAGLLVTAPMCVDTQAGGRACMDIMSDCQKNCTAQGRGVMFSVCMGQVPWQDGSAWIRDGAGAVHRRSMCVCLPKGINKPVRRPDIDKECEVYFSNQTKQSVNAVSTSGRPSTGAGICLYAVRNPLSTKRAHFSREFWEIGNDAVMSEAVVGAYYLQAPVLLNITDTCLKHEEECKQKCPGAKFTCQPNNHMLLSPSRNVSLSVKYDCQCPQGDQSAVAVISGGRVTSSASRVGGPSLGVNFVAGLLAVAGGAWTLCSGLSRDSIIGSKIKSD